MKIKTLFLATAALAALASCSNDETVDVNQGSGIRMKAFLNKATTRAAEMNPAGIAGAGGFKVHAYCANNAGFNFTDVFKNANGGTGDWNSDNKHYWPGDDSEMEFFAYAPTTTVAATDGKTIPDYTISATSAKDQTDLVVGYNKGKKSLNEAGGLEMNFRHALSQVVLQAKNSNTTNMKVEVIGVKVGYVKSKGTLTMPTATTTNNAALLPLASWSAQVDELSYTAGLVDKTTPASPGTAIELNANAQDLQFLEGGFMLLPQTQTKWTSVPNANGAYLAVLCRISQNDGTGKFNLLYPKADAIAAGENYGYSAVPVEVTWEPGKKYTYTLDFFGNGGGGQVDPEKPDGGDEIVGGPIKFTVTVDNWTDINTNVDMK